MKQASHQTGVYGFLLDAVNKFDMSELIGELGPPDYVGSGISLTGILHLGGRAREQEGGLRLFREAQGVADIG